MIRKRAWFSPVFRFAIRGHLRRGLDGVWARGLDAVQTVLADGPVILAPTHVNYWDALLTLEIEHALGADGYALMDRQNLRRLPFFGWLGAIPVDLDRPGSNRHALKAAAQLLDRPGRVLFVFPQGRFRPPHQRPLALQPGIHLLARMARAPVVPVSLAYLFQQAPQPAAYLDFGRPLRATADRVGFLAELEARLVQGLDRIDAHHAQPAEAYVGLLRTRAEEGFLTRLLSGLIRRADGLPEVRRG